MILPLLSDLVKRFEGSKLKAYQDSTGVWTIGVGHTGKDVWAGLTWTQAEVDMHLTLDLQDAQHSLMLYSPALQNPGTIEALTSFVFNLGIGSYRISTLCKYINAFLWDMAKLEIVKWDHAGGVVVPGLLIRRQMEASLINT